MREDTTRGVENPCFTTRTMSDVLVERAEEIVPLLVKYLTRTAAIPLTLNHTVPLEHRLDAAARGYDVEEDLCVSGMEKSRDTINQQLSMMNASSGRRRR